MIKAEIIFEKSIAFRVRTIVGRKLLLGEDICLEMNESAMFIWSMINGINNLGVIIESMSREYNAPQEVIEQDVMEFITSLYENKAILEV